MDIEQSYNRWAGQYDTDINPTRDLEALALRETLTGLSAEYCIEIGCGTGKNTSWLLNVAKEVTAVDFSEGMLARAREKVNSIHVKFLKADINLDWHFAERKYGLAVISLVLEHIEDLKPVFEKLANIVESGGYVYLCELHPYKQYSGSKARFETEGGTEVLTCFVHHLSDFVTPALAYGFEPVGLHEYFDQDDRSGIPRLITILLKKK